MTSPEPVRQTVSAGTRFGPYEIRAFIGAGGMGAVYRAHDTRLGRDVALKLITSGQTDEEAIRRFEREARAAGSLQHPNVLVVHDFGEAGGQCYLVTELLRGRSLRDRLRDGPFSWRTAVDIGRQAAAGLAAAHARGIVHRDVKPENIFVTDQGLVKILDFGIAKLRPALTDDETTRGVGGLPTAEGVLVGTVAYMAPEQIHGAAVDARADLFALGIVLYEMLAGRHPFLRDRVADTIAAILRDDAPALPASVPAGLKQIVERCLVRTADDRFQSSRDLEFTLSAVSSDGEGPAQAREPRGGGRRLALPVLAAAAAAAVAFALARWTAPAETAPPARAFEVALPPNQFVATGTGPALALSPDGRTLIFAAIENDRTGLYRRILDSYTTEFLTAGYAPFFSLDGRRVGFFTPTGLYQIPVEGGTPSLVCKTGTTARGGTWIDASRVVFNPIARGGLRLSVDDSCRDEALTPPLAPDADEQQWPTRIAGGEAVMFASMPMEGGASHLSALDLSSRAVRSIGDGTSPVAVAPDWLLFARGAIDTGRATLFVTRLDARRGTITPPSPIVEEVWLASSGAAQYAASADLLAYVPPVQQVLRVVDPQGTVTRTIPVPATADLMALSPDGRRVALSTGVGLDVVDLDRGVSQPVSDEAGRYRFPFWSPDSRRLGVRFQRRDETRYRIRVFDLQRGVFEDAVSSVPAEPLAGGVSAWTPDGRALVGNAVGPRGDNDVFLLPLATGVPTPLVATSTPELSAKISPDGKRLAYMVRQPAGAFAVFVQRFDVSAERRRVSTGSGEDPAWGGPEELFYRSGRRLLSVRVRLEGGSLSVSEPRDVATRPFRGLWAFGVLPGGTGFVMMEEQEPANRIRVLTGWRRMIRGARPSS
jgi:Tol biopolymer transport system component